jgi:type I restriction enzyme, S subunit
MDGEKRISNQALESTSTKLVPSGNVIVSTRVTVGKAMVNKIDIAISQDLTGLLIDKQHCLPEFVAYQLKTEQIQSIFESQKRGATIKGITREDLENIPLLCPPFSEQGKIVRVLWLIQSAIEVQEKIIQTTTELKKALMQKLFTEGLRGEPQKETEIGLVPRSCEVIGLREVFELTSGKTRPTELTPMPKNGFIYPVYGGNGILGYSKENLIDFKTIVLGRVGAYCGNVYLTDNKSWISDNALYAKVFLRECDLYYLSVALKRLNLNRLRNTGGQPLISQSIIYSQKIAFPKIDEQTDIANILSKIDEKIKVYTRKKEIMENLFKSMLHHLMTGQIRVKDLRVS